MTIHEIINLIEMLEPFPQTAMQLIEIAADESRAIAEVCDLVKTDANLASNVLRLANSAYFGLKQEVDSLDRAVTLLGAQFILEIALFSMTASTFKDAQDGYALEAGELWRHSIISAIFARELAKEQNLKSVETIFTAALIKDIGKVILNRFILDAAMQIDDLVDQRNFSFSEAEKMILGIDHAELGALAFEKWHFPESLVLIVRNHHLQKAPAAVPRETCVVYLADTICSMLGFGAGRDGLNYPFNEDVLRRYFDIQNFEKTVTKLFGTIGDIEGLAGAF
jgi:putative nucleotidyltransferase with HDIG domain